MHLPQNHVNDQLPNTQHLTDLVKLGDGAKDNSCFISQAI